MVLKRSRKCVWSNTRTAICWSYSEGGGDNVRADSAITGSYVQQQPPRKAMTFITTRKTLQVVDKVCRCWVCPIFFLLVLASGLTHSSHVPHNNLHAKLIFHWFSCRRMHFLCDRNTKLWVAGDSLWAALTVDNVIPQFNSWLVLFLPICTIV